jgi:glycosyltransferase involved in cell wall biosynthesis
VKTHEIDRRLGLKEDDFVFLSVATWQERKNLPGTIEAFFRAFPDEANVILVIKTYLCFTSEKTVRAQVAEAFKHIGRPRARELGKRLKIVVSAWAEELMIVLAQRANCYLALHHSEGWCYPLFDAACNGTPVVATAYAGPMDYLDPRFHSLVRYELASPREAVTLKHFSYIEGMTWAVPDLLHAAEQMRSVYEQREKALVKARAGAAPLREKYALEAVGQMARQRLQQLFKSL